MGYNRHEADSRYRSWVLAVVFGVPIVLNAANLLSKCAFGFDLFHWIP